MGEVLNYIELYNFYWENIMENTQESTQVPSAQIEQVSQFQESLTPTLLKENESAYESVRDLREALKAEDVLNIALTGPYGSGKSSVLHTLMYLKDEKWNYLPISLATLDDDKHQKIKDEETEDQQELLDNQTNENLQVKITSMTGIMKTIKKNWTEE